MASLRARLEKLKKQKAKEQEGERESLFFGPEHPGGPLRTMCDGQLVDTEWTEDHTPPYQVLIVSGFDPRKALGLDLVNKSQFKQAVDQEQEHETQPSPEPRYSHPWPELVEDV